MFLIREKERHECGGEGKKSNASDTTKYTTVIMGQLIKPHQ
jgi:hypothetical protein